MNTIFNSPEEDFTSELIRHGFRLSSPVVPDGDLRRCHIKGDRPGTLNGWYWLILNSSGLIGAFGSWKEGSKEKWYSPLKSAPKKWVAQAVSQAKQDLTKKRKERHAEASKRAKEIFATSEPASPTRYTINKGIEPLCAVRKGSTLVIPIQNVKGEITSLQYIKEDGRKRFLKDGEIKGGFVLIGEQDFTRVNVCEGYATGVTVFNDTGITTLCALTAGNIYDVCREVKPYADSITIFADNDHLNTENVGLAKANAAALIFDARVHIPQICGPECICTDFNDVANCASANCASANCDQADGGVSNE